MERDILVVEDDLDIQEALVAYLSAQGYRVRTAADGVEAITQFQREEPALVLLDVMLPKVDGFGVLEVIRGQSQVPVIMLTAMDGEQDQLRGFDLLVDDYVTKPFSPKVLMRKVAAVLRRVQGGPAEQGDVLSYRDLRVDQKGHTVTAAGQMVELTNKEYELLVSFLSHPGQVMTRQMLLDTIWQYDFMGDTRVVDNHVKNLRKKLPNDPIETVRGVGYRVPKAD